MVPVKKYLNKSRGIKSPFSSPEWERADYYRQIRNRIMHAGGLLDSENDKDKDLIEYAQRQGLIPVIEADGKSRTVHSIALTPEMCDEALRTYRDFIRNLIKACEEKGV